MDAIYKLRILLWLLRGVIDQWKQDVWANELDARHCCDGRECGCGGATWRDIYSGAKP